MIYPAFFPCPTWQFSEAQTAFANRTPMESGHARQRRRWNQTYTALDLNFIMATEIFSRWHEWAQANGFEWFTIPLDRVNGEKVDTDIRLTSVITYAYDAFDRVTVNVSAEVDGNYYG